MLRENITMTTTTSTKGKRGECRYKDGHKMTDDESHTNVGKISAESPVDREGFFFNIENNRGSTSSWCHHEVLFLPLSGIELRVESNQSGGS